MGAVIRYDRLSCGIPVCIQTSDESKLLSVSVWINAGSAQDPAGKGGLAHLCEHLLLRPLTSSGSRSHRMQFKTGAIVNGCTDPEWVEISARAPLDQSKTLIDLISALVRDPYRAPHGIEAEKKVILQELAEQKYSSVELLAKVFQESAFTDNPFFRPIGGTPATLGALNSSDVQWFYSRFLIPSNIIITAYGATNVEEMTALLDMAFKGFPEITVSSDSKKNEIDTTAKLLPEYRPVRIQNEMSEKGSDCRVLAGFVSVPRRTEDYWAALAFEVLMADGPGSFLTRWFRSEHHWIYGVVSMTEAFSNWGSQYFIMNFSRSHAKKAVEYLGRQWRRLPEFVTEKRVVALRNRFATRALSSLEERQDRMTLMRDTVMTETRKSRTLQGGMEIIVTRKVGELNIESLLNYIRQCAKWENVSLLCTGI